MRKVLSVLFLFCLFTPSFASLFKADDNVIIGSTDSIPGNAYLAGNAVIVNGVINGDLFAAGNSVEVNGVVLGDLMVGANTVYVNGNVTGDVRAAGSTVTINGVIGGEVLTGSGFLLFNEGSSAGELTAGAGNVLIAGRVNGNVTLSADNITVAKTSSIAGFLNYTSNNDAVIADSSVIKGVVEKNVPEQDSNWLRGNDVQKRMFPLMGFSLFGVLINVFSTLLSGYVLVRISTKLIKDFNAGMSKDFLSLLVKGFGFLILVPIAALIGLITMIAAPLSIAGMALYGLVLYIAGVLSAFFIGRKLIEWFKVKQQSLMIELLTGVVALELIGYVPVLGGIVKFVILLVSIGSLLNVLGERWLECKSKKVF